MIRKGITLLAAGLLFFHAGYGQNARETTAKFKDGQQPAVVADYMADEDFVEEALREKLEKEGFGKRHSEKGYDLYKATNWGRVSTDKLDVYIKVDGRKGKSNITMMVAKGYDNFVSGSKDGTLIGNVQSFLNSFGDYVKTKQAIIAQEEAVKKLEKENEELLEKREGMQKMVVELNTAITEKQAEVNTAKLKIQELKNGLN